MSQGDSYPLLDIALNALKIVLRSGILGLEARKALRSTCKELREAASHTLTKVKFAANQASDIQHFLKHGWTSSVEGLKYDCLDDECSLAAAKQLMKTSLPKLSSLCLIFSLKFKPVSPLPWDSAAKNWPRMEKLMLSGGTWRSVQALLQHNWPSLDALTLFDFTRQPTEEEEEEVQERPCAEMPRGNLPKLSIIDISTRAGSRENQFLQQLQACHLPALSELSLAGDTSPHSSITTLSHASWLPQLRSLDICVGSNIQPLFQKVLEKTTSLTSLTIYINPEDADSEQPIFIPQIPSLPELHTLLITRDPPAVVEDDDLNYTVMQQLAFAIESLTVHEFPSLKTLEVGGIPLTADAARSVGKLACQLRDLGLINYSVSDAGLKGFVDGMAEAVTRGSITLEIINLSENTITRGLGYLLPFCMKHCAQLQQLSLDDKEYTEEGSSDDDAFFDRAMYGALPFVVNWVECGDSSDYLSD